MVDFASVLEVSATDFVLFVVLIYVVYRLFFKKHNDPLPPPSPVIPPLKKQDLSTEELLKYNGTDDEHICVAVLGKVRNDIKTPISLYLQIYDVTRGKSFYGPGGPYENLAGHDATRALANMDAKLVKDEYDDHSGLSVNDIDEAKNWADSFSCKLFV